jgi:hypothetical protein
LPPAGRVPAFGRLATLPPPARLPAPAPGRPPGVGKVPIDGRLLATWPPLGRRTFEVLGRDIDGVREATLRDPPPLLLDALGREPPLGRAPPPRDAPPPPPRAPPPPPPRPPPPPPPPRPPRAHISLANQAHNAIETITINNFFMAAPFMVKRISLELNL